MIWLIMLEVAVLTVCPGVYAVTEKVLGGTAAAKPYARKNPVHAVTELAPQAAPGRPRHL